MSLQIKKQNKDLDVSMLEGLSKHELIQKIQSMHAHNMQLRNLLAKGETIKKGQYKNQKKIDFSKYIHRHILLRFYYLGWNYHGYVVQEDTANTIEHHLFEALIKTCLIKDRSSSNYHRCGRTDKGVSSFGQIISIDIRSQLAQDKQDDYTNEIDYCKVLNRVLPDNIQCVAWCPVDNTISARFDCTSRTYKYFFPKGNLNIEKMKTAAKYLVGSHDFRNLCKMDVGNGVVEFIRNVMEINVEQFDTNEKSEYSIYFMTIKGKAFLWHQIRCIMGILFLIGEEKEKPEVMLELLDVSQNPRKPEYSMASEVPLNLFQCEYDINENWQWSKAAMEIVFKKLRSIWTHNNIKTAMIKSMLDDLEEKTASIMKEESPIQLTACLLQGVKAKNYIPLMKRQKCDSLEDKIQHFVKRSRIEYK